jgi:hypothetical protein
VTTKDFKRECDGRLLIRHAAVIWIEQCRKEGHPVGECLQRAACLDWAGRYYAARTLEDWYYAHQARGSVALDRQRRSDRGKVRALDPQVAQAIVALRKSEPQLSVTAVLARLRAQGVLEADKGCSLATVYRFLRQQGLDRRRMWALRAGVGDPAKGSKSQLGHAIASELLKPIRRIRRRWPSRPESIDPSPPLRNHESESQAGRAPEPVSVADGKPNEPTAKLPTSCATGAKLCPT